MKTWYDRLKEDMRLTDEERCVSKTSFTSFFTSFTSICKTCVAMKFVDDDDDDEKPDLVWNDRMRHCVNEEKINENKRSSLLTKVHWKLGCQSENVASLQNQSIPNVTGIAN